MSVKPLALTFGIERDLRAAFAAASRAEDTLEPLDWLYNTHPAKYLHNGAPAEFSWLQPGGFCGVFKNNLIIIDKKLMLCYIVVK